MDIYKAELLTHERCQLGEGPVWQPESGTLHYTDILGCRLHSLSLADGRRSVMQLEKPMGCFALRRDGGLVLGMSDGVYLRDAAGRMEPLAQPRWSGLVRANDGKCDPDGRFWCGTSDEAEGACAGGLYVITPEGRCAQLLSGLRCANGLAFRGDEVWFIDSPSRCVMRYCFDAETLTLREGRPVVQIDATHGLPDGMTMDEEGMLWVAHWGGGFVGRYDPADGRLLAKVMVPASQSSSCCFGGDDMRTLFVTSAAVGRDEEEHAGKMFCVRLPVAGVESWRFGG